MLVEAVIAEGAIEALDEGVLHRFARLHMMESNAGALSPEVEGFAGELRAIVHGDGLGKTTRESQALENGNDRGPADGGVDMDGQALAREVIDERQAAEAATGGQLVVDKVHRPAFIGSSGHGEWHAGHRRQFPAALAPQGESFLTIEALGAFVIDDETFGFEHRVQDGSTPARLASRPVAQTLGCVLATLGPVLQERAVPSGQSAEAAGGEPKAREDFVPDGASRFGL